MYLLEKDVYLLTPFLVLSLRVYSRSKQWQRIILPSKWNTKIGNVCICLILLVATAVEKMFELLFYLKKECTEFQIKPDPGAGVKLKENCFFLLSRFHNLFSSIVLCLWTFFFYFTAGTFAHWTVVVFSGNCKLFSYFNFLRVLLMNINDMYHLDTIDITA